MQLVAYGAQDIYLTGNPMITYFKVVYRRHTNFAMESIQQTFNGTVGFGNRVSALISRNGDLVSGMILEATLPAQGGALHWIHDVGHHLISDVTVEIGGQQIDQHYADWLEVWAQLSVPAGQKVGYREMIGQGPRTAGGAASGLQTDAGANVTGGTTVFIPLQFWFCRNVGLALPLIALQYHEVKVNINFAAGTALTDDGSATTGSLNAALWVDYIYLDTDERRRFAQVSHEYLIEQLQTSGDTSVPASTPVSNASINLNFNHPVKELIWICKPATRVERSVYNLTDNTLATDRDNFTGRTEAGVQSITSAVLNLNGQQRFAARSGKYFNLVQTRCHTNVPDSRGIYVYSFALKPEDHQPSGSCNFSRIDNASLNLTLAAAVIASNITVYAVNYNVLRIMSGMGGLAYSN